MAAEPHREPRQGRIRSIPVRWIDRHTNTQGQDAVGNPLISGELVFTAYEGAG